MGALAERVIVVLGPYVGDTVADTCVRATALSLGKTAEEIQSADFPTLETNVRRLLGPVAPASVIDSLLDEIREGIA
jgi:hypothetical protein